MMRRVVIAGICAMALGLGVVRAQTTPLDGEAAATQGAGKVGGAIVFGPPTTMAKGVARQQHWIGVAVENIPPTIGKLMKLEPGQGLLVLKVLAGSPAEKAKLQAGDLLITVNDKALVSQPQLAEAANAGEEDGSGKWQVKTARLGYIREGERRSADITPDLRPAQMQAIGQGFVWQNGRLSPAEGNGTYQSSNGATLQVGPGYEVNLNGAGHGLIANQTIKEVLSKGETIVLSQESDGLGNVHSSVTVGGKRYDADPAGLAAMPAEVRELVKPLLEQAGQRVVRNGPRTQVEMTLQEQVKEQERMINELTRKLEALQGKVEGTGGK